MKYQHDYHGYSLARPVIKNKVSTVEDAAGSLSVTHALIADVLGKVEGLQDIARKINDAPGSIDPDAWQGRLGAIWSVLDAADARLKNDIILLYAVVEADNDEDPTAPRRPDWAALVAEAQAAICAECAPGLTEQQIEGLSERTMSAVRAMLPVRAPDVRSVLNKMAVVDATNMHNEPGVWESIVADLHEIAAA